MKRMSLELYIQYKAVHVAGLYTCHSVFFLNVSINDAVIFWYYVASVTRWVSEEHGRFILTAENGSTLREIYRHSTVCTKTPICSGLGSNRSTCGEKPITNRPNHDIMSSNDQTTQPNEQRGKVCDLFSRFLNPASYIMGTGSLSRGYRSRGVTFTTHPIYRRC